MQSFTRLTGIAAPLLRDDVNTDQIAPVLPLCVLEPDYAAQLFVRWRRRGNCIANGVLPVVLAPQQHAEFAAQVTAVNGSAAFCVDLINQHIRAPNGTLYPFAIDAGERTALLEGLDDIGLSLRHAEAITAWEERTRNAQPWLQTLAPHKA